MNQIPSANQQKTKIKQKKDRKNKVYLSYNGFLSLLVSHFNVEIDFTLLDLKRRRKFLQSPFFVTKMTVPSQNQSSVIEFKWKYNKRNIPQINSPVEMIVNGYLMKLSDETSSLFQNYLVAIMDWFQIKPQQPKSRKREAKNPNSKHQQSKWHYKALREISFHSLVFGEEQLMQLGTIAEQYVRENDLKTLSPTDTNFVQLIKEFCVEKSENYSVICHYPETTENDENSE